MEFFAFVLLLLAAVAMAPWMLKKNSELKKPSKKPSKKTEPVHVDGFPPTQQVTGVDRMTGIAIDEVHRKLCLVRCRRPGAWVVGQDGVYGPVWEPASSTVVRYGDILSVEVFEDTAPSQGISTNVVLRVELHIIVKKTATPTHTVLFLDGRTFANSVKHRAAMALARHWHGVLQAAIHAGEMRAAREKAAAAAPAAPSLADELQQLVQLRDQGVLTEQEFQQQKARLLA